MVSLNDTLSTRLTSEQARLHAQEIILHKGSPRLDQRETLCANIDALSEEIRAQTTVSSSQASELRTQLKTISERTHAGVEALQNAGEACAFASPFAGFIERRHEHPEILRDLKEILRMQEDTEARRMAARAKHQAEMTGVVAKIASTMTAPDAEGSAVRWSATVATLGRLLTAVGAPQHRAREQRRHRRPPEAPVLAPHDHHSRRRCQPTSSRSTAACAPYRAPFAR